MGRSPYCTILVTNSQVSREHAAIRLGADGCMVLEDLDSTNGTLVNGRCIDRPTELRKGDIIGIGSDELTVTARDEGERDRDVSTHRLTDDGQDKPSSDATQTAIELLEALAKSARDTSVADTAVEKICVTIDELIGTSHERGAPLDRQQAQRLRKVAGEISGWYSDGRLSGWAESVNQALGERTTVSGR